MLNDALILGLLILVNGVFSCAELGILSVNINKIKFKADNGDKKAQLIKKTLDQSDNFLSTIQIAISLISLFSGAYAGQTFADPVVEILVTAGVMIPYATLKSVVVLLITILLSYFTLVFGELVPKRIALQKTEAVAYALISPINFMTRLTKPVVKILSASTNLVLKLMGIKSNENSEQVTEEEIRMMVDAGSEIGNIDEEEMKMINNIFEFDDKTVEDIATHRTDMAAIDIDDTIKESLPLILGMKYSRVPVYEDNIDNIIGILHIKDLMRFMLETNTQITEENKINIREILRKPYFVPTSKKTDELFTDMKVNKVHIAIVVDEYGGTVGLVTMEDLIEEIMGNIFDEYDDEELPEITAMDTNTFVINGTTALEDVAKILETDLPIDEFDTISGFVIGQLGRIPSDDERPEIEYNNILFKVTNVEEKRIEKITACKII